VGTSIDTSPIIDAIGRRKEFFDDSHAVPRVIAENQD
jgi:hypothetical protein